MPLPPKTASKLGGAFVDGAILSGAALTSIGAWQIYAPAGIITLGVLLLAFGVNAARFR